jgi:peptidoglycan/xylan/chitin deacetylase (PgdA/CDA1 family)
VRSNLKSGFAAAAHSCRAERLYAALAGRHREPVVLGYHRVVADFSKEVPHSSPSMLVSRAMLEHHLDWLARRFEVVSLDELQSRIDGGSRGDRPIAAITFDDGYQDVYEQAFPLLMRKGLPATVFVVTDYVGTDGVLPHDRLYLLLERASHRWRSFSHQLANLFRGLGLPLPAPDALKAVTSPYLAIRTLLNGLGTSDVLRIIRALEADGDLSGETPAGFRTMTWEMLAEMSRAGIGVGSHTRRHCLLANEDRSTVVDETLGSQQALAAKLGRPATCFAYPDGSFDQTAIAAVAATGYQIAVTTCRHRDENHPWLTLPRLLLWERSSVDACGRFSPAILSCQASGIFDKFSPCQKRHARAYHDRPYGDRHISPDRLQRTVSLSRH